MAVEFQNAPVSEDAEWIFSLGEIFTLDDHYVGDPSNPEQIGKYIIERSVSEERLVLTVSRNPPDGREHFMVTLDISGKARTEYSVGAQRNIFSSHITSINIMGNQDQNQLVRFASEDKNGNTIFEFLLSPSGSYQVVTGEWLNTD